MQNAKRCGHGRSLNARSQQVQVLVDARSNSLVVTGEPGAVETAKGEIELNIGRATRKGRYEQADIEAAQALWQEYKKRKREQ